MDLREKLEGFPTVYYTSLIESEDRREFMREQFERYGINHKPSLIQRYTEMNPKPNVTGQFVWQIGESHTGVCIGHLECLKHWYYNTDEEYAIFCEDDHDFSSIDYWTFTWQQFMDNLPKDWECVQLVRIVSPIGTSFCADFDLKLRIGRWWGSASMMRRSWVKKILDRHIHGDEYRLEIPGGYEPIIENVLYWGISTIFNFPLLTENNSFKTTLVWNDVDKYIDSRLPHKVSEKLIKEYWKCINPETKIEDMLRLW